MTTTTIAATMPGSRVPEMVIAMAFAPASPTLNADAASNSRTTIGKTPAATSTGWATRNDTNTSTAKATSADTARATTATAIVAIETTTAPTTATTGDSVESKAAGSSRPPL